MIAAYIRVSSKAQSHAMQRHAIEQAAGLRGDVIDHWYEEKASAKTIDRPALKRLRADILAGKVGRLYVYRLDRLARTGIRDTLEIVDEAKRCGCAIVNLADGFALDGPVADVVIAVMAWANQMERLAINERIAGARERVESEGRTWGRQPSFDAAQAERVRAMLDDGASVRAVAAEVGLSRSVVGRLSRKHAGKGTTAPVEETTA